MMKNLKLSLTITLLAALSMGSMHAMESTTPQKKQQLLQRLVILYKVNRDLMRQNIHLNLPKEKLKQLRAERRRILKRVAIAGLTAAFLAAIGVAVGVAAKKRGERKAPAGQPPTFGGLHKKYGPPEVAPSQEWKKGVIPKAAAPFVAEEEEFDDPQEWEAEAQKTRRRTAGTLRKLKEPKKHKEMRRKIGDDPFLEQLLRKSEEK